MTSSEGGGAKFKQLLDSVKHMTDDDLEVLNGDILHRPPKKRAEHQQRILRRLQQLFRVKATRTAFRTSTMVWSAVAPPGTVPSSF